MRKSLPNARWAEVATKESQVAWKGEGKENKNDSAPLCVKGRWVEGVPFLKDCFLRSQEERRGSGSVSRGVVVREKNALKRAILNW